jgi:hypothetical protein
VSQPLTASVSLILIDRTIALPEIDVDALQTVAIDVGQSLSDNHQPPEGSGAAVIDFEAESAGAVNTYAQVLNTPKSLAFTFPFMQDGAPAAGPLDGVAWYYGTGSEAFFALQNTTENETTAIPTVFSSGKETRLDPIRLAPHQAATVKLPPVEAGKNEARTRAAGLRVEYDGSPGSVVAQGWVEDDAIGFSDPIAFHPKSNCNCGDQLQHRYGTGVMIGSPSPSMGFPSGTVFSPYLAMSNRSDKPLIAKPVFSYDSAAGNKKVRLHKVSLGPQETATMNLLDFQKSGIIPAEVDAGSIDLQFKGEPGALISELASVDQDGSFVSRVPLICAGVRDSHMSFWRTDGDWQSQLTLQNLAHSQNDVEVTISYPGGVYVLERSMAAGASAMVSINELQQQQQPDAAGRRIPLGAILGGVNIWSRSALDGLVVNAMLMNAVTKTCGQCTDPGYVTQYTISDQAAYTGSPLYSGFAPHPVNLSVGVYINVRYSSGSQSGDGPQSCSSDNTSVATATAGGANPVSPGTADITANSRSGYFTDPACSQPGYLSPSRVAALQVVPQVSVTAVGFTGGYQITVWPSGPTIDNTQPTWSVTNNPNYPVAYKINDTETLFATLSITPPLSTSMTARIKVFEGSNEIATKGNNSLSGNSVTINNITMSSSLHGGIGSMTPTFTWKISFDGGANWMSMGDSGPHTIYCTYAAPLEVPFADDFGTPYLPLYDRALQNACGYAQGIGDMGSAITAINQGIAHDIFYAPKIDLGTEHPLNVYDSPRTGCMCSNLSNLLRGLLRSIGIDGTTLWLWGGPNTSTRQEYSRMSDHLALATFRIIAPLKDGAEVNPHFMFHSVVSANGGQWYDPSFGVTRSGLTFDESNICYSNCNGEQQVSASRWTTDALSSWECIH